MDLRRITAVCLIGTSIALGIGASADTTKYPWTPVSPSSVGFDQGKICSIMTNFDGGYQDGCLSYPWTGKDGPNQYVQTPLPAPADRLTFGGGNQNYMAGFARNGQLNAGGWEYFYGDGVMFGTTPNTYLFNTYRTSTSVYRLPSADQAGTASALVTGAFGNTYGPNTKICLEVWDYGVKTVNNTYTSHNLLGRDCKTESGALTLSTTFNAVANHLTEFEVVLHNPDGVGASRFQVLSITHSVS